jgi:hypothetical protein
MPPRCRRLALLAAMGVCCCSAAAAATAAAAAAAADDGGAAGSPPPAAPTVNITLTASAELGPVFDGLGGLSAGAGTRLLVDYREPQRGWCVDSQHTQPSRPGHSAITFSTF